MYNNVVGKVIKKELQILEQDEATYNFEVEDNHNYYVSKESVLVHNDCAGSNVTDAQDCTKGKIPNYNSLGQKHHAIGNKPFKTLKKTTWGKHLNRNDYIMKALTVEGHKGYQKWHRMLDISIDEAIESSTTLLSFQLELNKIYNKPEIIKIFGKINIVL